MVQRVAGFTTNSTVREHVLNQMVVQIDQKKRGPCGPQLVIFMSDNMLLTVPLMMAEFYPTLSALI
jgi:hypothetical protein